MWDYGPESWSWRARMHARRSFRSCRIRRVTCEPPQTRHAQFTVSIDRRTNRPTDQARRKAKERYLETQRDIAVRAFRLERNARLCLCLRGLWNPVRLWLDKLGSVGLCRASSRNQEYQYGEICPSTSVSLPKNLKLILAEISKISPSRNIRFNFIFKSQKIISI